MTTMHVVTAADVGTRATLIYAAAVALYNGILAGIAWWLWRQSRWDSND